MDWYPASASSGIFREISDHDVLKYCNIDSADAVLASRNRARRERRSLGFMVFLESLRDGLGDESISYMWHWNRWFTSIREEAGYGLPHYPLPGNHVVRAGKRNLA